MILSPDALLTVDGIYLGGDGHASAPCETMAVDLEGIRKDRHFGYSKLAGVREKAFHPKGTPIWNGRQWSAVSREELDAIGRDMGAAVPLRAEWLGANFLFSGYEGLTALPAKTRLVFSGGCMLLVLEENVPCVWPAKTMELAAESIPAAQAKLFPKCAVGRRGLVGWAERAGTVAAGERVEVFLPRRRTE